MPCSVISANLPDGPSGPSIPGFGIPFAIKTPDLSGFLDGFPENLLDLLEKLQLLIPPGSLKPQLSLNFGKDAFDAILKLLDQFMPFLMLYKFFLPVLNLIICIIEVLCAIPEPYKITRAMIRLFRNCLPPFLNLFPFLALIIMIISLILLLIALIEYIIAQIIKLILLIIKNILMLKEAFEQADSKGVLLIIQKIGAVLCIFQNLFVLLAVFTAIIQVIKDMINLAYSIPACDDNNGSSDGCCTPDVCPAIIRNGNYLRKTGKLKYLNKVYAENSIPVPGLPPEFSTFTKTLREETWQFFDPLQDIPQQFINIIDGYDVPADPVTGIKPSFFPAGSTYNKETPPKQAAYTVDLTLFYNPAQWNRFQPADGIARYIQFKDCIVLYSPSPNYVDYSGTVIPLQSGVFSLAGGIGYENDGTTLLKGYDSSGINIMPGRNATIDNFLHIADYKDSSPVLKDTDGYQFNDVEYVFKPNTRVLLNQNLITAGCIPEISLNKGFINEVFAGGFAIKTEQLKGLLNADNFPNTAKAQEEMTAAIADFANNVTLEGAANLQNAMLNSLDTLKKNSLNALNNLIGLGFDPCKSEFTIEPKIQFTSKPIKVSVDLKESNGVSLGINLPTEVATNLASRIKAHLSFGSVTPFAYDGYQKFVADLTSSEAGSDKIMISFDNEILCVNNIPANIEIAPTRELQQLDYKFIFTPTGLTIPTVPTAEGDGSDGAQPRRDVSDLSIRGNEGKDGS